MTRYINWDGKQVAITEDPDLDALFVIDTIFGRMNSLRYGHYKDGIWRNTEFKHFPAEFKVAMLLLGVSP